MSDNKFEPYIKAEENVKELTLKAVILGAVLGILFAASSVYLALKVGMTVSASIPIRGPVDNPLQALRQGDDPREQYSPDDRKRREIDRGRGRLHDARDPLDGLRPESLLGPFYRASRRRPRRPDDDPPKEEPNRRGARETDVPRRDGLRAGADGRRKGGTRRSWSSPGSSSRQSTSSSMPGSSSGGKSPRRSSVFTRAGHFRVSFPPSFLESAT